MLLYTLHNVGSDYNYILPYSLGGIQVQKIILCRCEEVTLEDVIETAKLYHSSGRELKLRTRAGMGICGGKTCRPLIDRVLQDSIKKKPANAITLKVQPPVRPVPLVRLGGKENE